MSDSGMIHKIHKAKEYAAQPDRIQFQNFKVQFDGMNDGHQVEYNKGDWKCDCRYFTYHGLCSHTMAMERILNVMLPLPAETEQ